MAIEFRCIQCQKLLRVSDDARGRKARCPQCGTIQDVSASSTLEPGTPPATTSTTTSWTNAGAPPTGSSSPNPFAEFSPRETPSPENPFRETPPASAQSNPYVAPHTADSVAIVSREAIRGRIQTPATVLLVISTVAAVIQAVSAAFVLVALVAGNVGVEELAFNLTFTVAALAVSSVTAWGAWKMKKLENYALSMVAATLAVIPCTSTCCIVTIPVGIWALVVLIDPQVKNEFR